VILKKTSQYFDMHLTNVIRLNIIILLILVVNTGIASTIFYFDIIKELY